MKSKIVIVDNHLFTRNELRTLIESSNSNEVVAEVSDVNDVILKVREKQPDIVIITVKVPGRSVIDATRKILSANKSVKIIALSNDIENHLVTEMLNAGVVGFLLKENIDEELLNAIQRISHGDMVLSSAVVRTALSKRGYFTDFKILETKLHRPQIMDDYIIRQIIIDKLELNVVQPLSIISAGAGFGKSIVVSEWLEQTAYTYTWISLDNELNDFRTFLFYIIAAIEKIFPKTMVNSNKLIKAVEFPPFNVIYTSIINEICTIEEDFILVLDDYHLIKEKKVHQFFNEWFRFPPTNVHLSIITRKDPPLDYKLLQNSGRMIKLRTKDLIFNSREIADLFKAVLGIELNDKSVQLLKDKTEGWVIGLRLASMAIEDEESIEKMSDFLETELYSISEYLISEVLSKQPDYFIDQLIDISGLDRFCAELIGEVLQNKDEQKNTNGNELIKWLIDSNMFLISIDSEQHWFRYHHLFQELLQKQLLKKRSIQQIKGLNIKSSAWFEKNEFIAEAIEYAIKAEDTERAIRIIKENWEDTFEKDLWCTVEGWLTFIPEKSINQSVNLLLARVWIAFKQHRILDIPALIDLIEQCDTDLTTTESGYLAFANSMISYFTDSGEKALEYAEQALALIPKKHYIFRTDASGWWTVAMQRTGQGEQALRVIDTVLKKLTPLGEPDQQIRFMIHAMFVNLTNANIPPIKKYNKSFFNIPFISSYMLGWGLYFKAIICWWNYNLEDVVNSFNQLLEYRYQTRPRLVIEAYICMALALQELNRPDEAKQKIEDGLQFAEDSNNPINIAVINSGMARLNIVQGNFSVAEKWRKLENHNELDPSMLWWVEVIPITRCRVLIANGTDESLTKVLVLLKGHMVYAASIYNKLRTIEIIVLQSLAYIKLKKSKKAEKFLKEALNLAADGEFIRPFVESYDDFIELIIRLKKQKIEVDFIDLIQSKIKKRNKSAILINTVKKQYNKAKHPIHSGILTEKEIEILHYVSAGLKNQEIADKLLRSEPTIKKHIYNIFQKINVKNRMSMVLKAKELGLIN